MDNLFVILGRKFTSKYIVMNAMENSSKNIVAENEEIFSIIAQANREYERYIELAMYNIGSPQELSIQSPETKRDINFPVGFSIM